VSLHFQQKQDALRFQNGMAELAERFSHFREKYVLDTRDPSVVIVDEEAYGSLTRVLSSDYVSTENNESPNMSLNDIMSNESSTVTIYSSSETLLKTLEKEEVVVAFGTKWYKCHLIPNNCKMFKNDPNRNHDDNFIYSSWNFHQLFDALHVTHGLGVVLRYVDYNPVAEEVLVAPNRFEYRYRVNISLEFKSASVASTFGTFFKDGTQRLTDTKYVSFLFAKNVDVIQDCLRKKFMFEKEEHADPWLDEMDYDENF
jgi:hypothetical protein